MSRQVSVPSDAECVVYRDVSDIVNDFEWNDFLYEITMQAQELWPSLDTCDEWPHNREDHALLENTFIYFGVSEYGGICSIWLCAKDDTELHHLAQRWIKSVAPKFKQTFDTGLVKLGSMSNGEAVYQQQQGGGVE